MFSDKKTKDLAKTAYQIMTKDVQEEEAVVQEIAESTEVDLAQLAQLIDSLLVEGIAEYIGLFEQENGIELTEEEVVDMTNEIMEHINNLSEEDQAILGESLIEAHGNSLTED